MATDEVNIKIRRSDGPEFLHKTSLDSTVRSFKQAIAYKCGFSPYQQRLIYGGHILDDDRTLRSYGLEDGRCVILTPRYAPDDSRTNATGGTDGTSTTNSTRSAVANLEQRPQLDIILEFSRIEAFNMLRRIIEERVNTPSGQSYPDAMQRPMYENATSITNLFEAIAGFLSRNTSSVPSPWNSTRTGWNAQELTALGLDLPELEDLDPSCFTQLNPNTYIEQALQCTIFDLHTLDQIINVNAGPRGIIDGSPSPSSRAGENAQELVALVFDPPDMEALAGALPDFICFTFLNPDPNISRMLRHTISNLRILNQIIDTNAELRRMPALTDILRKMMQEPVLLGMLSSPASFQRFLAILRVGLSYYCQQQSTQESGQVGSATSVQSPPNSQPPGQWYTAQLSQLEELGFINILENITALIAASGNIYAAVERLWRDQHHNFL